MTNSTDTNTIAANNQKKAHLGTIRKALTNLGLTVEKSPKKDMLAVTIDDKLVYVTSTYRPDNQPGKKLLTSLRYKDENMNNVAVSAKKLPELMRQLADTVDKKETTMTYSKTKETKMNTDYFDQICDQLRKDSRRIPALKYHEYEIMTRTTKDGTKYPVIEVKVQKDSEYQGTLVISTMQREVSFQGKTKMQDTLIMRLENWKPYRHNNFNRFNEFVNPRYVGGYVECFMDLNNEGQVEWMKRIMDRTRFLDPNCSFNNHVAKEYKEELGVITVDLDVNVDGTMVPCVLTLKMTGQYKTYVTAEITHNGEQVNFLNQRFPAWIVSRKLKRLMRDRDMLSKLSEMTA